MGKIEERGRRENAAQGEKDKSQPGTYGEMEQAGKKTQQPGQKQRQDTGDSNTEMEQARKAAP
jgi:hypothetical protein